MEVVRFRRLGGYGPHPVTRGQMCLAGEADYTRLGTQSPGVDDRVDVLVLACSASHNPCSPPGSTFSLFLAI